MGRTYIKISEVRVYVINCDTDFDFRKAEGDKKYNTIITKAEELGTVYSLQGFQEAINNEELSLINSFILIR
jgi:hypothetical protein